MDKVELTGLEGLNTGELIFVVAKGDRVEVKLALSGRQLLGPVVGLPFKPNGFSKIQPFNGVGAACDWMILDPLLKGLVASLLATPFF